MTHSLRTWWRVRFHSDKGATDPVLIIAGIAITLILIVGGSFAISGFISNAQDLNARGDLDRVSVAQEKLAATEGLESLTGYAYYLDGPILTRAREANMFGDIGVASAEGMPDIGLTFSEGTEIMVVPAVASTTTGPKRVWLAYARSASGTWFVRTSESAVTWEFGKEGSFHTPEGFIGASMGTHKMTEADSIGLQERLAGFNRDIATIAEQLG